MLVLNPTEFDKHLDIKLKDLDSEYKETNIYIKSIMKKYITADKDYSKQSVVLLWFKANDSNSFELYQDIGDWVFFSSIMFPESIKCETEFYQSLGQGSYYRCYRILQGSWPLYEELADKFRIFVEKLTNLKDISQMEPS